MDRDVFIAMVVNGDGDDVALARVDGWPGELPVHGEDALPLAEPGVLSFLYLQMKFRLTMQHQNKCLIMCRCFFFGVTDE